jgi:hypothetical protein
MSMIRHRAGFKIGRQIGSQNGEALSNDVLQRYIPSIFATEAHESRSERFVPVATSMVLDGLRREGFEPFYAAQARTRVPGKADFTKHMVRLRNRSLVRDNGDAFEIILANANDGTSAYHMIPGFFRFVCANGLMTGDTFETVKVRHSGSAVEQVIEGAYRVLEDAPKVADQIDAFKSLSLTRDEAFAYAEAAHVLRFPQAHVEDPDQRRMAPVSPERLLAARRYEDQAIRGTLWGVFNVVQENVVGGGQTGLVTSVNERGRMVQRRQTVRPVEGIDGNKALNRALWTLAESMAKLKAAA